MGAPIFLGGVGPFRHLIDDRNAGGMSSVPSVFVGRNTDDAEVVPLFARSMKSALALAPLSFDEIARRALLVVGRGAGGVGETLLIGG